MNEIKTRTPKHINIVKLKKLCNKKEEYKKIIELWQKLKFRD